VVLGVEDDVLDAALAQKTREALRLLDRDSADQRRPSARLLVEDVVDDRVVLLAFGAVDEVRLLDSFQVPVIPESLPYLRK
jgi:hypothetical protein